MPVVKCRACDDPAEGRDGLCRSCRGFQSAKVNFARRQGPTYPWDAEKDARLRRCYNYSGRRDLSRALTRLASELRYPRTVLRRRAEQLGVTMWRHVRWTPAEITILEEYAGSKTVGWISRQLKKRTGRGRSYNSVKCKAEEIGRSLRLSDGYSKRDLAELFRTTEFTVAKWFAKAWLATDRNGRVSEETVRRFIKQHPNEWHFKRVDEAWVKGLLFPSFGTEFIRNGGNFADADDSG
jgi:hypothetical protein